MKKITSLILVLVVSVGFCKAQISQESAKVPANHSLALGQSIVFNGGYIASISIPVFTHYHPTDHSAKLFILAGDGVVGSQILFQKNIVIPSLSKFYSMSNLSIVQVENLWTALSDSINSGVYDFDDLETTFAIGESFPSGTMTFVIELDTSVSYLGYKMITIFGSCPDAMYGCSPVEPNPYSSGQFYFGWQFVPIADMDMAFKIPLSTSLEEFPEKPFVILGNILEIKDNLIGFDLTISNVLGQILVSKSLKSEQSVSLEGMKGQVIFVNFSKGNIRKTFKVALF